MAKGIYRTATPISGAEYVAVDHGVAAYFGEMTRKEYEAAGYEPAFADLPTKEQHEALKKV